MRGAQGTASVPGSSKSAQEPQVLVKLKSCWQASAAQVSTVKKAKSWGCEGEWAGQAGVPTLPSSLTCVPLEAAGSVEEDVCPSVKEV